VSDVFRDLIGQSAAVEVLRSAVAASHGDPGVPSSAMTHAWLFTGPAGSGRSVAARAFAAALQCPDRGCGECVHCRTVLHGTHGDVRSFSPEGLSIGVKEMRAVVVTASRTPTTGRLQIVLIEDADRLTEGAANALLKAVEEPARHTVFLLCAPTTHPDDIPITIRSRCRLLNLASPSPTSIAQVLEVRDGVDAETAEWAASVCGGHVGRARRLAMDETARAARAEVLELPARLRGIGDVYDEAAALVDRAKDRGRTQTAERNAAEMEELKISLGAGGTGKGVATAARGTVGMVRELERRQKLRVTRTERDSLDGVLVDLSGFCRDVITLALGSPASLLNPDIRPELEIAAQRWGAGGALARLDAVLACREAIEANVKPLIAVEALMMKLFTG
jgi:DNA polymerase III subunit delta'